MLWQKDHPMPEVPSAPAAYSIEAVPSERADRARALVDIDGATTDAEWRHYSKSVVPDGLFAAIEQASSDLVGTIGAIDNPAASRFYFPGGGQLGYLVVAPKHRCRGIGSSLIATAVRRLREGGYRDIYLGVQAWRLPAIRAYLSVGFQPFIHDPNLTRRWRAVFAALEREPHESEWLRP